MIDQLVYVQIPKGSERIANKGMVYKLLKALYDLKQAPRLWYKWLFLFLLKKLDLKQINADHNIFEIAKGINGLIVSMIIDVIKSMSVKEWDHIEKVKLILITAFEIVDISLISFYLRLKVERYQARRILTL